MLSNVMVPLLPPVNCVEDSWGWWLHATSASGRRAPATEHIWMPKSTLVRRWVHQVRSYTRYSGEKSERVRCWRDAGVDRQSTAQTMTGGTNERREEAKHLLVIPKKANPLYLQKAVEVSTARILI
jgi:hypothetical protein